ncbi:IS1 family transposase [Chryseobacterium luteum]|uniref:Transposase n=1 Tax=Chryseobacterium luteum TaxID=421531 RepID=A0A085ZHE0_9FLAO|nr:IS1 family transposase [Chryseobacterium luteum]KFF03854.1 hypothetical protein IX38_10620 [Chryseobacterium luteum]
MQVKVYSCVKCVGDDFIKYGKTNYGKQCYQCKFRKAISVLQYSYNAYKKDINTKVIQLTKEGMGIRSIARILKISTTTLLKRIVAIANSISQPLIPYYQTYELDEMRFFIRKKSNMMWLVYAINKSTQEIAGFYIGRRNNKTLNSVVKTLVTSKAKKIYTDKLRNYQYLIPKEIPPLARACSSCPAITQNPLQLRWVLCYSAAIFLIFSA